MKLDAPSSSPSRPSTWPGGKRRARSRRGWLFIIAVVIAAHLLFILYFQTEYFEIFRTEIRGDEGGSDFVTLDRPFLLIPYPQVWEPAPPTTPTLETTDDDDDTPLVLDRIGEPSRDIEAPRGAPAGMGDGRPGPRRATVEPKPLFIPWPAYPADAPDNIRGTVELLVYVNENGTVDEIRIARGLPHESLNRTAVDAARRMRFVPGEEKGAPTAMWVRLSIGFQPR